MKNQKISGLAIYASDYQSLHDSSVQRFFLLGTHLSCTDQKYAGLRYEQKEGPSPNHSGPSYVLEGGREVQKVLNVWTGNPS